MPFSAESYYFYRYLQTRIEENHKVVCQKADDEVRTVSMWEKIRDMIRAADVIIANCSGRNPNVLYELGMAHAFGKKFILLSCDPIESVPTDIRHFEVIRYDHSNEMDFLQRLDTALEYILVERYDEQFHQAARYFEQFAGVCAEARKATKQEFVARYKGAEEAGETIVPVKLLAFIIGNSNDVSVMEKLLSFVPEG